jgi:hypothetical protein
VTGLVVAKADGHAGAKDPAAAVPLGVLREYALLADGERGILAPGAGHDV